MADIAASVLARLKNRAQISGRSYQLCLQLFCQEEFLRRLEKSKYAGIGASVVARIKNTRTPFSIDFGVGDVIVPKQEKRKIPTQLSDFDAPTVNTYSLETTIAEKIDAILSLMEFSSRMKDYYDIYYLANKFDFDGKILTEALKKTFANRGHSFTVEQFEQVLTFGNDDAMQKNGKRSARRLTPKRMITTRY